MDVSSDSVIDRALEWRAEFLDEKGTTAWRVLHGEADGVPGLIVEKLGDVLIAQIHQGRLAWPAEKTRALLKRFQERLGTQAVYRKVFVRDRSQAPPEVTRLHSDPQPWIGSPVEAEIAVTEQGLRFFVHPFDGFSTGLFLEHRENRQRIRDLAFGRRVLNLFSYTGGFSVAAALGQAASVSSVDLSKRYLEWSRRNFGANSLSLGGHWFFCSDVFEFYARARRQERKYDLIVLDPPTFARARRPRRDFVFVEVIDRLVAGALQLLDPGGVVLLATNDRQLSVSRLEETLQRAAHGRTCTILDRPSLPVDFHDDPGYASSVFARFD